MAVRRIVANIAADSIGEVRSFYMDLFGLENMMDLGWIVTPGSGSTANTQMSILGEGSSGSPGPRISHEPVVAGRAGAMALGDVRPWRSGPEAPENAVDHTTVGNARHASALVGQKGNR